jgi:geranylgeranyl transferase type-2 subunit beta
VYHDAHVLYTLSAVQILALFDRMDLVDADAIAKFLKSLQREEDGAVMGDEWGEVSLF